MAAPALQAAVAQLISISPSDLSVAHRFFNEAFLTCLAKKAAFTQEDIGSVSTPVATRPLSVVDSDNRLIAGAFRAKIKRIIEPWVSAVQRGFIKGRYMLQNIRDIEEDAMLASLRHRHAAIILFDFEAAFRS